MAAIDQSVPTTVAATGPTDAPRLSKMVTATVFAATSVVPDAVAEVWLVGSTGSVTAAIVTAVIRAPR